MVALKLKRRCIINQLLLRTNVHNNSTSGGITKTHRFRISRLNSAPKRQIFATNPTHVNTWRVGVPVEDSVRDEVRARVGSRVQGYRRIRPKIKKRAQKKRIPGTLYVPS